MALCATTALAGAVPRLCVRGARGRFGGVRAGTWRRVSFVSPSPPRVFRAACGGPSRPAVPYPRSLVRHSMRSVRSARSVRLPFRLSPRVPFVCVRSRSRGVRSPPRWVVWRAHLAWSRHWALVGPFHVVRAPPRVLPRSLAPSGVLGGAAVRSRFPPTWLGVVGAAVGRPRGGAFDRCVGRLGSCAPPPPTARPLGGLSGSALWARACGCGGPALSLWGLRAAVRVHGVLMLGGGLGGGGGVRRFLRLCGRGGARRAGGRSASFRPSAFPGQATKRASLVLCCPWGAWPPIPLRFVLTRLLWVRSVRRPGAQAWARLFFAAPM